MSDPDHNGSNSSNSGNGGSHREDSRRERGLDDVMHALKNCLSTASSGCLLIDDALDRGETGEIRDIVKAMRESLQKGFGLSREISSMVADLVAATDKQ